jgi:glutamate transport system permease protein
VWRRLGEGLRATLLAALFAIIFSLIVGTLLAVLRVQLNQLRARRFPVASARLARLFRFGRGDAKGRAPGAADGPAPTAGAAGATSTRVASFVLRSPGWLLNAVIRVFVEVFRGAPVVITIFFVWRVLPEFGLQPPDVEVVGVPLPSLMWSLVIGLTLYNGVVIGEILRSGMQGLPRGQTEAAQAIGLTQPQTIRLILLPQAFRIMLPALISQLVVVLKDTALGFIITYGEVMRIGNLLAENPRLRNPLQMYLVIGTIFILVNYTLSRLAIYTERRLARGRRAAAPPAPAAQPAGGVAPVLTGGGASVPVGDGGAALAVGGKPTGEQRSVT